MPSAQPLADAWGIYERAVLDPAHAGAVQRKERRRGFFAGATSMLGILIAGFDPSAEPTDADIRRMDALCAELVEFQKALEEGRA